MNKKTLMFIVPAALSLLVLVAFVSKRATSAPAVPPVDTPADTPAIAEAAPIAGPVPSENAAPVLAPDIASSGSVERMQDHLIMLPDGTIQSDPTALVKELKEARDSSDQLRNELEDSKKELAQMSSSLKEKQAKLEKVESSQAARTAVKNWAVSNLGPAASVEIVGDTVVVSSPEATFKMGGTKITSEMRPVINQISEAAMRFSREFDLMVEGHADPSPVKSHSKFRDNWDVAYERAYAVAREIKRATSKEEGLVISSRGSTLANPAEDVPSSAKGDRRVLFVFTSKRAPVQLAATSSLRSASPSLGGSMVTPAESSTKERITTTSSRPATSTKKSSIESTSTPPSAKKSEPISPAASQQDNNSQRPAFDLLKDLDDE